MILNKNDILFGAGDVLIAAKVIGNLGTVEFYQVTESLPVGEEADTVEVYSNCLLRFIYPDKESAGVLIKILQSLQDAMPTKDVKVVEEVKPKVYSIDEDGQPKENGWYNALYDGVETLKYRRFFSNGVWYINSDLKDKASFGNYSTKGERYIKAQEE